MHGTPSWEQATWLVGILSMVSMGAFLLAWRIAEIRKQDRHDVAAAFEQRVLALDQSIEFQLKSICHRLDIVEDFKTSTTVILSYVEKFHTDVAQRFDELHQKREVDMQGIHRRLDTIFNQTQLKD